MSNKIRGSNRTPAAGSLSLGSEEAPGVTVVAVEAGSRASCKSNGDHRNRWQGHIWGVQEVQVKCRGPGKYGSLEDHADYTSGPRCAKVHSIRLSTYHVCAELRILAQRPFNRTAALRPARLLHIPDAQHSGSGYLMLFLAFR